MTAEDTSRTAIDNLVAKLGASSDEEIRERFGDCEDKEFIEEGIKVATPRIADDGARILPAAWAFMEDAREEQLAVLMGVSNETLRLAAWCVQQATELYEARKGVLADESSKTGEDRAKAAQDAKRLLGRKEQLAGLIRIVGGSKEPFWTRYTEAYSKAEDAESLATCIERLAKLGHELLSDKSPAVMKRCASAKLTKDYLDGLLQQANELGKIARAARIKKTGVSISSGDVDLRDGWSLRLLGEIVEAFEMAHEIDPSIPRLPVVSLRKVFFPTRRKKEEAPEASETDKDIALDL